MDSVPTSYGGRYHTPQMIRNARENCEKYAWAKDMKKACLAKADAIVAKGADYYWKAATSPGLPRNIHTNFDKECPECGTEMTEKYGVYSWLFNQEALEWKIECPNCHTVYPSNDFKSYWESGLDSRGIFQKNKANPLFLINELYPEKGENCYVDDGMGWINPEGDVWAFVAYYNKKAVWRTFIFGSLACLTEAFLYTGDMVYADLGLVILHRIADLYPDMHLEMFKGWKPFYNNDGNTGRGKIGGCISEPFYTDTALKAIDLFIPVIHRSKCADLLNDIYKRHAPDMPCVTTSAITENIYCRIVREVYRGVVNRENEGNTGMHESTLALAAVVAGKSKEADEWIDWIFRPNIGPSDWPKNKTYGGNILPILFARVDRDGFGDEVSPTYNSIWLRMFFKMAKVLSLYPGIKPEYDLAKHPKFLKMVRSYLPLFIHFEYIPHMGDTALCGNPDTANLGPLLAELFVMYQDPEVALAARRINGDSSKGLLRDVCLDDPEQLEKDLETAAAKAAYTFTQGASLPGFGYGSVIPGHGTEDNSAAPCFSMYYGRTLGHGHLDTLNIGYYSQRLDLMPDLGYPEYTDSFNRRRKEWESNTVSHNTVVVDKAQKRHAGGRLLGYATGTTAGYIKASGIDAYPDLDRYERTAALVVFNDNKSYIIDYFKAEGKGTGHYLLHGTKGITRVQNSKAMVTSQEKGTYAGEDIAYAVDPTVDYKKPHSPYDGPGFHYLKDVRHIRTGSEPVHVRWQLEDNWNVHQGNDPGVHLDVRMLSPYDSAALAKGIPPRNKKGNMKELDYLIIRKDLNKSGGFLACLSSWTGKDFIREVKVLSGNSIKITGHSEDVIVVKVYLLGGNIDYLMYSDHFNTTCVIEDRWILSGAFGMIRTLGDDCTYGITCGGTTAGRLLSPVIQKECGLIQGVVSDFTKVPTVDNKIIIKTTESAVDTSNVRNGLLQHVYIQKEDSTVTAYVVNDATVQDGQLVLFVGNSSLITSLKNPSDLNGGYRYDIKEGLKAWLPLCEEFPGY